MLPNSLLNRRFLWNIALHLGVRVGLRGEEVEGVDVVDGASVEVEAAALEQPDARAWGLFEGETLSQVFGFVTDIS